MILELFGVVVNELQRQAQWGFRIDTYLFANSRLPGETTV
jgi:hypothetical protein